MVIPRWGYSTERVRVRACSSTPNPKCAHTNARTHTQVARALPVLRCKNKFAFAAEEIKGGYRDLMLSVQYEEPDCGLRIIGEIQAHARFLKCAHSHQKTLIVTSLVIFYHLCA